MRITTRRLSFEVLEDRWTPSWGSVPPLSVSPPATFTSVSFDAQGMATGNAAVTSNEIDWYKFTASSAGSYTFEATTPTSSLDSVIGIYSNLGARRGYNDDISGFNTDSRVSITLTAGQSYFLGITNFTGSPNGSYTWKITSPGTTSSDDSYEQNDTQAASFDLGTLTATRTLNNLVMSDGHDWFKFTTSFAGSSSHSVAFSSTSTQGDLDLELYNASGTKILESNGSTNNEQVSLSGLAAGTYFVHVVGYQNAITPNYSLVVTPPTSGGGNTGGFQIDLRMTGFTASQQTIFRQAAARWAQVIIGDLPNATYNSVTVDDLLIDASSIAIDGRGGVLGQAGPDRFRSGTSIPYHGTMQFDSADVASLESSGGLLYTIMHEMGHVLGIGTIWRTRGLLQGAGTSNPLFTGSLAVAEYNRIFGTNATGVPVENSGGSGTRDAHWRETVFGRELMTGYLNSGVNPLSRVTAASLADLGYQVNLNAADAYSPSGSSFSGSSSSNGSAALRLAAAFSRGFRPEWGDLINYLVKNSRI